MKQSNTFEMGAVRPAELYNPQEKGSPVYHNPEKILDERTVSPLSYRLELRRYEEVNPLTGEATVIYKWTSSITGEPIPGSPNIQNFKGLAGDNSTAKESDPTPKDFETMTTPTHSGSVYGHSNN